LSRGKVELLTAPLAARPMLFGALLLNPAP
jgi:hypothetical protein